MLLSLSNINLAEDSMNSIKNPTKGIFLKKFIVEFIIELSSVF